MQLTVDVRASEVLNALQNGAKRAGWSIANAMNATLKDAQAAVRAHAERRMTIRTEFVKRQLAIIRFARGSDPAPVGRMHVGTSERLLLSMFEGGGTRHPFIGGNVAIPVLGGPARPSKRARVRRQYEFEALAFHRRGNAVVGARRTYIVPDVGVFQRTGRERRATRMLYFFRPTVSIPATLEFEKTARRVADHVFPHYLLHEVSKTLQFHGFGGGGPAPLTLPLLGRAA